MKSSKKHCPNCNSLQKFAKRKNPMGSLTEVYISCSVCKWRECIEITETWVLEEREKADKLSIKAQKVPGLERVAQAKRQTIAEFNAQAD